MLVFNLFEPLTTISVLKVFPKFFKNMFPNIDMWATKNGTHIITSFIIPQNWDTVNNKSHPLWVKSHPSIGFYGVIRSICFKYLTFLRPESLLWNVRVRSFFQFLIPKFDDVMLTLSLEWVHCSRISYEVEFRVKNDRQNFWYCRK